MRNQQHYDLAQSREYPFDDGVSLLDDSGQLLPEGILSDLSCTIDRSIAKRIFVSGVTKKGDFCSVVLSADNPEKTSLGVLNGTLQGDILQSYGSSPTRAVVPLVGGFQGHGVFGDAWERIDDGQWRFSSPAATKVLARCCFPIAVPGSQTARVTYSQQLLQSLVTLQSEGDIELSVANRVLGGQVRTGLVISLSRTSPDTLKKYAGQFQQRPESRNCGNPQPIETINGVAPDCCGRVFIELRGCAEPIPITNHCGVVIECPLTLADICPPEIDYGEQQNPDQCLHQGSDNVLQSYQNQPDSPTLPPNY